MSEIIDYLPFIVAIGSLFISFPYYKEEVKRSSKATIKDAVIISIIAAVAVYGVSGALFTVIYIIFIQ